MIVNVTMPGGLTKLAVTEGGQALFGEPAERLPRRWKSLMTGFIKVLRQEGTYIYVESIFPDHEKQERFIRFGGMAVAELHKREGEDRWVGTARRQIPCVWKNRWKVCEFEAPMEILLLSPSRIEGSVTAPTGKLNCKRCVKPGEVESVTFTWIPE